MPQRYVVRTPGLTEAIEMVKKLKTRSKKASMDAMELACEYLLIEIQKNFIKSSRGSSGLVKWIQHAPSTARRRGEKAPILFETGQLYDSITTKKTSDGFFIGVPNEASGHGGKMFMIASVHEHGALVPMPNGKGVFRIPARPFISPIFESERIMSKANKIAQTYFVKAVTE